MSTHRYRFQIIPKESLDPDDPPEINSDDWTLKEVLELDSGVLAVFEHIETPAERRRGDIFAFHDGNKLD